MRGQVNSPVVAASCALLLIVFAFPVGIYSQQKAYNKQELLQRIRDNSKDNSISINDWARLITENGVDFEMTRQDEAAFRKAGAVNEVIALIRSNFRPPRSLVVKSTPADCQVLVDGQLRGTTNAAGLLVIRALKPGSYKVTLRKQNYVEQERTVVVAPYGTIESFLLSPAPGSLNVTPNIAGARIAVRNLGEYPEKVTGLELAPGSYDIEVRKPGYRTVTRTVIIAAGAPYFLPITLEKMTVEQMLALGEESLSRGQVNEAVATFHAALEEQPNNPRLIKLVGLAYFRSGNYDWSERYFANAIALGEKVAFKIRHRHSPLVMCSGAITLSSKTFAFESDSAYIEGHNFEISYDKFKEYFVADDVLEGARLHTKARIPKPKGRKGEDEKDNNFYVPETESPTYRACTDCTARLNVIFSLMKRFATGSGVPDLGISALPTLKRRLPDQVPTREAPKTGLEPELSFVGREAFQAGGRNWTRYRLSVSNYSSYSSDMFAPAPDLPPCGANPKASRTWVDIFNVNGKRLFGFCALSSPDGLSNLWFALPEGETAPPQVFLVITDRKDKKQYKSNMATIY